MKYCPKCGRELTDDVSYCPSCGYQVERTSSFKSSSDYDDNYSDTRSYGWGAGSDTTKKKTSDDKKIFILLIKIFMIIGCIATGWSVIPLLWNIPMTIHVFKNLKNDEPISTGFKICALLFVNLIAGILLLCLDNID